jgi:DNA-binding MarR family transcriptional regulator
MKRIMKEKSRDYGKEQNLNLWMVIGFARIHLNHSRITQRMLKDYKLTLPQFSVLESLYHLGDMNISKVLEKTLATAGNMTVVIKNLEREALIERCPEQEDKRSHNLKITEKGKQLIEQVFPIHLEQISHEFINLTTEDKEEMVRLMRKLSGIA